MSRIGKKPIEIPEGVIINIVDRNVKVKGSKGELSLDLHNRAKVVHSDNKILVECVGNDKLSNSIHGLTRCLVQNMIDGVSKGFEKKLEIKGVGYRAAVQGNKLVLTVGYSHAVEITAPNEIEFKVQKNIIVVSGIDKQVVGQVAANIRNVRKPEPYKGKGIKYVDEIILRKPGKAAKAAAGAGGA